MNNSFDIEKFNKSIKKITDNNDLYDYLNKVIKEFKHYGNIYYCNSRRSIEGKYPEGNENNYLQIFVRSNSISMTHTRWENSSIIELSYEKQIDGNIKVTYEETNHYNNEKQTAPSTLTTKEEYIYDENKKFLFKEKHIKDESYLITNGEKQLVSDLWYCNYDESEFITRIADNIAIQHHTKKYVNYPNHDKNEYSICSDFKPGMYHSENIKGYFVFGYDSIAEETYNDLIEARNKIKQLVKEEK